MGVIETLTNKVKTVDGRNQIDLLGRFGEDDAQLLLGLADQAAVNLHKARLYDASITDRLTGLYNTRHFDHHVRGGHRGRDARRRAAEPRRDRHRSLQEAQ